MKLPRSRVVLKGMKRLLATTLVALGACSTVAVAAPGSPPRARLRTIVCQHALDPAARAVSATAVMRPLVGTRKMALRFQLLRAPRPGGPVSAVKGGDLGAWISPANRTLGRQPDDVWVFNKQVVDLAAPAVYRFRVSFRWTGRRGRVLGTEVRVSQTCAQPELRPDLLVQAVKVQPLAGSQPSNLYTATVGNGGATEAGRFQVRFTVGAVVKSFDVQRLGAHATLQESFTGPPCAAAAPVTVTVDPTDQVDDYNRANNSTTVTCATSARDRTARS